MTKAEELLKDFFDDLKTRGRKQATINNYAFYLGRFFQIAKIENAGQLDGANIQRFRSFLDAPEETGRRLNRTTQNYYLIALRSFLKYLKTRQIEAAAFKEIKLYPAKHQSAVLQSGDLEKILAAPLQGRSLEIIKLRDKAILELLFSTGLKVSELSGLRRLELDLTQGQITLVKNNRPRMIKPSNQCLHWLKIYAAKMPGEAELLFCGYDRASKKRSKEHAALSPRSIQRLVEKYAWNSGIKKDITPQAIRNYFGHNLISGGAGLKEVKESLGLASVNTTKNYR